MAAENEYANLTEALGHGAPHDPVCVVGRRDLPVPPSFDWGVVMSVPRGPGWSAHRRGCLKGKTAHANPLLLSPWD